MGFPVMAVIAAAQLAYGIYQTSEAKRKAKKLGEPKKYADPDKLMAQARSNAVGYTPAEKLSYFQSLVKNNNAQYQNALKYRPDMASTIQAGIDYGNIDALNRFAANDADLRRRDEQRLLGLYQTQDARNTSSYNQRLLMQEQALGRAEQAGIQNIWAGASTAASSYDQSQQRKDYYDYMRDVNKTGTTTGATTGATTGTGTTTDANTQMPFEQYKRSPNNYDNGFSTGDISTYRASTYFRRPYGAYNPSYDNINKTYYS